MRGRSWVIALSLVLAAAWSPSATPVTGGAERVGGYDFVDGAQALGGPTVTEVVAGRRGNDIPVNDPSRPGQHLGCTVQSEASVASYGRNVYVGYNDGSQCIDNLGLGGSGVRFIGFARSTDGGKTFKDLGPLKPNGKVWSLLGDPVIAVDTEGRARGTVYLASLAGDRQGRWYLAVGRSTDNGRTFRWHRVPAGADPDKEWIAVDNSGGPHDGTLYITWRELGEPSGINVLASKNGGRTWIRRHRVENYSVQGARVAIGPEGELHVVWTRNAKPARPRIRWSRSLDGGRTYSRPVTVGTVRYIPEQCDSTSVQGVRVNEFPSIAVDTFGSSRRTAANFNPHRGTVYVTYAGGSRAGDASDVYLSRLAPGARRWAPKKRINDDATRNDQFFPEVVATGPGDIAMMWTDRREDAAETPAPTSGDWLMRQWVATSTNGGRTISRNARFSDVLFPPPLTNPSLNTGMAECYAGDYNGLYSDRRGRFLAAWSDHRDSLRVSGMGSELIPDQNVYFRTYSVRSP